MKTLALGLVLLAAIPAFAGASSAQAEDRKDSKECIRERAVKARLCDEAKNYVRNSKEYGWFGIAPECRPERADRPGWGWKQQKYVVCDCASPCDVQGE